MTDTWYKDVDTEQYVIAAFQFGFLPMYVKDVSFEFNQLDFTQDFTKARMLNLDAANQTRNALTEEWIRFARVNYTAAHTDYPSELTKLVVRDTTHPLELHVMRVTVKTVRGRPEVKLHSVRVLVEQELIRLERKLARLLIRYADIDPVIGEALRLGGFKDALAIVKANPHTLPTKLCTGDYISELSQWLHRAHLYEYYSEYQTLLRALAQYDAKISENSMS